MTKSIQFGNAVVEVVSEQHEAYWFVANVIADVFGYRNPRQAASDIMRRNPMDFEGYTMRQQIADTNGRMQETVLLNEEGVYVFCMLAKTPVAVKFRRVVAEHIKQWRNEKQTPAPSSNLAVIEQQLALFSNMVTELKRQDQALIEVKQEIQDVKRGLIDINQPLRDQLVQTVRKRAAESGVNYRDAWHLLYDTIRQQKHIDVSRRAKNRTAKGIQTKAIDILDELGMLGYAVQVAKIMQPVKNNTQPVEIQTELLL